MQTVLQYGADLERKITHPVSVHEGAAAGISFVTVIGQPG